MCDNCLKFIWTNNKVLIIHSSGKIMVINFSCLMMSLKISNVGFNIVIIISGFVQDEHCAIFSLLVFFLSFFLIGVTEYGYFSSRWMITIYLSYGNTHWAGKYILVKQKKRMISHSLWWLYLLVLELKMT